MKKPIKKLVFSVDDLSKESLKFLRRGWCIDEDPNHLWLSKEAILLDVVEDDYGLWPEYADPSPMPKEIPEKWWGFSDIKGKMRKTLEKLWKENAKNEAEWE
jgi:hypothetical protein